VTQVVGEEAFSTRTKSSRSFPTYSGKGDNNESLLISGRRIANEVLVDSCTKRV
jgi:hypothetical protein